MRVLEEPLAKLVGDELAASLARVLLLAYRRGEVSYDEVMEEASDPEELLLEAHRWRLLLPKATSSEWNERALKVRGGEVYEMPRVVCHLIRRAVEEGRWDPEGAIAEAFREIGEERWEVVPELVRRVLARGLRVTAEEIRGAAEEVGLGTKVDPLIAELKATGVMSPKLGSLTEALKARAPIYELNPSLRPPSPEESPRLQT